MEIRNVGTSGITPFFSENVLKQIKTQAGRIAYSAIINKPSKPQIKEGIHEARGALKWIIEEIEKEEEK